ncbi:MAG: hypothetical protein P1U46_04825 [Patescibacteria group bacterium]|nr:hypothetical protein [Patescibacteria group bacterium]
MRFKIKIFLIITLFFITINSSFAEKYLKIEKNITYLTKKNSELIKQFDS